MGKVLYRIECAIVTGSLALAGLFAVTHPGVSLALAGGVYLIGKIALPD